MVNGKTRNASITTAASSVTQELNEWGIPDWRDGAAYGDWKDWALGRWRWEFLRRREDVRTLFDARKNKQYEDALAQWENACAQENSAEAKLTEAEREYIRRKAPIKPDDPRFTVLLTPDEQKKFGVFCLLDPRIGDVSAYDKIVERMDSFAWSITGERHDTVPSRIKLEKHEVVIAFSTDQPLAKQIHDAADLLKSLQRHHHGKMIKKPRHPLKWIRYLRTLDAFEVKAPWAEIAMIHPNTKQTEQTVRDIRDQAKALCFDF